MIQRIQSVFLLLAGIINLLLIYLPVYRFVDESAADPTLSITEYHLTQNALLTILNAVIGVIVLGSILLYKNRNLQMRAANLTLLLTALFTGLLFFAADTLSGGLNQRVQFIYGSYLPIIEMVFLFVAVRFIKRDEELVRSADRLR